MSGSVHLVDLTAPSTVRLAFVWKPFEVVTRFLTPDDPMVGEAVRSTGGCAGRSKATKVSFVQYVHLWIQLSD